MRKSVSVGSSRAVALLVIEASLIWAFPSSAGAQEIVIRSDRPSCSSCQVRMTRKAALGSVEGPGYIGRSLTLPRDSKGRYYVSSMSFMGEIKMYDSTGTYIAHLAHRGQGPGEVTGAPRMVVTQDDSVHVFDQGRYSVFSPSGEYARSVVLPYRIREVVPIPGGFVVGGSIGAPDAFSSTLHFIDRAGRLVRSFAPEEGDVSAANLYVLYRVIAQGQGTTVWSGRVFGEYTVEQWTFDGRLERTVKRNPDWFEPKGKRAFANWKPGTTKPPPQLRAVHEDGDGLLWVVSAVADLDWEHADTHSTVNGGLYDSVIEVIDLASERVVARTRVDELVVGFVGNDLFSYGETEDGWPEVVVWTVELVRPPQSE